MSTEYTRLIIRQGAENERQDVLFRSGEPAYVTNYKRLFVGDGATLGGVPVGMRFLGFVEFDPNSDVVERVNPGYTGDIVFETQQNLLFVLSGDDYRNKNNYISINKTPVPDNITIYNNNGRLSLITNSLHFGYFANFSIGRGLEKNPTNLFAMRMKDPGVGLEFDTQDRIAIKRESVSNDLLAAMDKDTVKARLGIGGRPDDVTLREFAIAIRTLIAEDAGGSIGVPIGTIIDYGGVTPPAGYLICDGSEYEKSDYPELAATLGGTWGTATSATFFVPNLLGRATMGSGQNYFASTSGIGLSAGSYGGSLDIELTRSQIPRHHHEFRVNIPLYTNVGAVTGDTKTLVWGATDGGPDLGTYDSIIGRPHSNLQPSAVVTKCIKAK
jgi:microcystin-dependent protein